MGKDQYLQRILTFVSIFVVGYYAVNLLLPARLSQPEKSVILSTKTGELLPKEEVDTITHRQAQARLVYTLTGKVVTKSPDSLSVEISVGKSARLLRFKFSQKMIFLAQSSSVRGKDISEEKEISLAEVAVGDTVTFVFPKGLAYSALNGIGAISIDNLIVNIPGTNSSLEE